MPLMRTSPPSSRNAVPAWWRQAWRRAAPWAIANGRVVSSLDRRRLFDAVPFTIPLPDHLGELRHFLAMANPVPPDRIPPDLVTMNSVVCIRDAAAGETDTFALVYPYDADGTPNGRSITAPFGASVFGRRVGEHIAWATRRGLRHAIIEALRYQPEREGHFDR